ncbi:MAG: SDR family NAD(P)-dependent oxidoreductase [Caulobacteraceae bacterium]|nr:SDR family NAD(P)-dependent oxidoreductase [Caulobacteraceae bacterium]
MRLSSDIAAVVTGGASGLGRATVEKLRADGVKVAIFDRDSVNAGFEAARAANGQERILVCCAGIGSAMKTASRSKDTGEIKHFPLNIFELTIQINLIGTFRCVAKSAAGMLTLDPVEGDGRGALVMTASVAAEDGQIGQAAYSASKGGVVGMTLPIARDLSSEGIRINTILPGIFETPLMMGAPEKVKEALAASVPFPKRLGNPQEYASLALEMIRNPYFNGEDVRLDGAIRMGLR